MPPRARPPAPACVGSARRARLPRLPHVQGRDQVVPQQHDRGHQRPTAQQPQHRAAGRAAPPIDIGRRACKRAAREHVHDAAQDAVLADRHHLQQRHNGRRQEGRERPVDKPPDRNDDVLGFVLQKEHQGNAHQRHQRVRHGAKHADRCDLPRPLDHVPTSEEKCTPESAILSFGCAFWVRAKKGAPAPHVFFHPDSTVGLGIAPSPALARSRTVPPIGNCTLP